MTIILSMNRLKTTKKIDHQESWYHRKKVQQSFQCRLQGGNETETFVQDFYETSGELWSASNLERGSLKGISQYYSKDGTVSHIYSYNPTLTILDENIDLRPQYAKEIKEFEIELAKFEKEYGIK